MGGIIYDVQGGLANVQGLGLWVFPVSTRINYGTAIRQTSEWFRTLQSSKHLMESPRTVSHC